MPVEIISICDSINTKIVFIDKYHPNGNEDTVLKYFQIIRRLALYDPDFVESYRVAYETYLPELLQEFNELLLDIRIDAVVTPPSRYKLIEPYVEVVKGKYNNIIDLSQYFTKMNSNSISSDFSCEDYKEKIIYDSVIDLSSFKSILFLDDVMATGKTAKVIIDKLVEAGLAEPCILTIACPLWIKEPELKKVPEVSKKAIRDILKDMKKS